MLLPVSTDDEDLQHGGTPAPPAAKTAPSQLQKMGAVAAVAVLFATAWIGFGLHHDNAPPPVIFEAGKDGARPTPMPVGDEAGGAIVRDSSAVKVPSAAPTAAAPVLAPPPPPVPPPAVTPAPILIVHVSGHVRRPGVYRLFPGARVMDAVRAAGGATPDADTEAMNLAAYAGDGSHIEVLARGERPTESPDTPNTVTPDASPARPAVGAVLAPGPVAPDGPKRPAQPINLNTADSNQLQSLPTVGPEMASRILQYRNTHGGFRSVEELDVIEGIGPKKLDKIRPYVIVG